MRFGANRVCHSSTTSTNSLVPQARKTSRISQLRDLTYYKDVKNWFVENLRNYCNTTSLHGFNYITRKGITSKERIFWISVVVISIVVSIVLVIVSWLWNRETPTVTVIESSHFPTWNIPFPAITICNFNKISKYKAIHLAKTLNRPANLTEADLLNLFRITMYFSFAVNHTTEEYQTLEKVLQQNDLTIKQLIMGLSPDCMQMISRCIWKGSNTRCDSLFQRVNTTEGICCSFNYFGRTTNNFPEKIAYQVPKRPYRVTGCGYPTGLSVILNPMADDYFGTYFSSYGFRLLIHDAYNFPDENAETKVVTATRECFVRINPESTYATSDIKTMDMTLRNCLFSNERRLSIMQRYSFINCMTECRVSILFQRCGCVPYNLPNNGNLPTCGLKQISCIIENREIFTRALPTLNGTVSIVRQDNTTKIFPCNCLPDCEVNHYPSEITMGRLNSKLTFNRENAIKTNNMNDNILLHVFFSDLMATRYRMEIFQNWLSALASFGGLLGLIMGFSIVAAFEFLYFLTFRPIFNYFNE
ncbi:pickpocket protein 11 [Teleopsis dalmanni]|uniref:pickpocket protein 11 n=1 Tax=Teleopsis dalmanni TaxID=139649 RepID=UPI0018CF3B57|nr:pickpocket protein 11 [Teleopsis dalmanni]